MRKKFLSILCVIIFGLIPCFAEMVLQGEATYNVNSARADLVADSYGGLKLNLTQDLLFDFEHYHNQECLLKGNLDLKDRTIASFSDGTYGIAYKNNPNYVFYYSKEGLLIYVDKKLSLNYPYKTYKYTPNGKLVNMTMRVSYKEAYMYEPDGKLIAHWIGNNGYDEHGNLVMTRHFAE